MDDIQSWWEVPSIAHFCSLFRVAFNLLDFDIEELEEALLTDGAELTGSSLLQELIVRLLCGCLGNNGISIFNYQMFLRRLFRTKCRELGRENPFDTDIDFQFLPLRTKVEILHALCDFRLDAEDVIDVLKNLDSDSLRVHPLGHDENKSAYWYFYGTRLYREDFPKKRKKKKDHDKQKSKKKRREDESGSSDEDEEPQVGMWRVLCYTEDDWQKLAEAMADSECKEEQALYTVLTEDFLPEIPRLFEEKERLQRKRFLESQPRRTSSRIEKLKSQRALDHPEGHKSREDRYHEREKVNRDRMEQLERRAARALRSRSKSESGSSAGESSSTQYTGRQTNNSLSSATGKIIIQPNRQKFKTSQLFRRTREDLMTGLYKVLDRLKTHEDAWPFVDPVEEEYAPKYYSVIAKPMDLQTMEDKLDNGEYGSLQQFKSDFQLIVDNCRQYNGSDNEYTLMVSRLQEAFQALVDRYLEIDPSSEDEPAPQFIRERVREKRSVTPVSSEEEIHSRSTSVESNSDNNSNVKMHSEQKPPKIDGNKEEINSKDHKSRFRKKTHRRRTHRETGSSSNENIKSRDTTPDRSQDHTNLSYKKKESSDSDNASIASRESNKEEKPKIKKSVRKPVKRTGVIRNAAAIEALELATEQTLKDINKWLDDTPRFSDFSSNSNSPLHITCTEEMSSIEAEYRRRLHMDRPMRPRDRLSNELHRRRMFKEQMGLKRRREVQRTIDRLQPGKSKGNLLSKENQQDGSGAETKFTSIDSDENTPKLSLGKVLPSDLLGFGIGDTTRKESEDDCTQEKPFLDEDILPKEEKKEEEKVEKETAAADTDVDSTEHVEQKKEKPTPNLSAWFKAFGAPKPQMNVKRKSDSEEARGTDSVKQPKEEDISVEDDKDKRTGIIVQSPARRQRKTSTGSSVSERSSFSQEPIDGNSPRPSLDEPYLSPQPEMKTYYHPPINGTIKVGFYQDTCFPKGSSEKSSSPREIPNCSPRDLPSTSPRTPYCSPRNAASPREYPNASPREYPNASPREYPNVSPREYPSSNPREYTNVSPREYPNVSPREYSNISPKEGHEINSREYQDTSPRNMSLVSPKEVLPSPKQDYPYTSTSDYHNQNNRIYSSVPPYPSHLPYYDTSRPITDQYKTAEKASVQVYPVKKRAYNEINDVPKGSPEQSTVPFKGGSFTPTKGAMDQERTFTPTPGRMPSQTIRAPEAPIQMTLPHHPLQHHLIDPYTDERHMAPSFFANDGIYNKPQGSSHSMFAQPSVISSNFSRESNIQGNLERSPPDAGTQTYNRVHSPFHGESRENFHSSPSPETNNSKSKTSVSYQNRSPDSSNNSDPTPINYSNANSDNPPKDSSTSVSYLNRQTEISKPNSPINYGKVPSADLLTSKANTSFSSYSSSSLEDIFPTKVNPSYNRTMAQLPPTIPYNPNPDLSKISVPPLSYSNQPELLTSKMNYNHPMADIMQSSSRYNYQMSELMQGKPGVYNHAMQELIQGKTPPYSNMMPGNIPGYNRPIADIIPRKVGEFQGRDMPYQARTLPSKPETSSSKPSKKSRKKKSESSAGFQQYVAPTSEAISMKSATSVTGSAFNFGPPLKDSYSSYLDDMRSPYFVPHTEGGPTKGAAAPSPSYFLSHASSRTPTYPHPFMNAQYQQYLQRHPEELLRPMMLHQGLLPPPAGYPAGYLGMHDAINRPSWL